MSTTSEFTLRAPGRTTCEVIDAEDLATAETIALAWGAEVGAARVEIFDGEPDGASQIAEVVVPATVRDRWPQIFPAVAAAFPGDDEAAVAEMVLAAEERGGDDAAHSIRQSEADGEWLDDDGARDGATEDLAQTAARDLVRDEDGDVVPALEQVYVTAWVDAYRAGRDA